MPDALIRTARFDELTPRDLYALLKLRSDVFIVEQECAYPDLDGRDTEPDTVHMWVESDGEVVSCLRVLCDAGGSRIGRVCTAKTARGTGIAATLVRAALDHCSRPVTIDAQSYLEDWYAGFGFVRTGDDFLDDGIWHVPMRLD